MALTTVSSDRLATNVKNTNFTTAEKQDLTNDIKPLLGSSGGGNKNKIINGSMIVSQRGTSFAAANNIFTLDRFRINGSHDGAVTVTQSSTSPDGFAKSLKIDVTTADTSIASGQYLQINNRVEAQDLQDLAFGTSAAKTITVSFYVRSNLTGTYTFAIQQADNSGKQVTQTYTINSANTWERKTFTFAGDTSGVINDDNGTGFQIYWNLAIGSQYTTGTSRAVWTANADADFAAGHTANLLSSTSNEFYLTGIQLEVSSVVTEYDHRSFGQELALCQRYFYLHCQGNNQSIGNGTFYIAGQVFCPVHFPVEMRTTPTGEIASDGSGYWYAWFRDGSGNTEKGDNWSLSIAGKQGAEIHDPAASGTAGQSCFGRTQNASSKITFSAEL
jgi:ribosomal protein L27